MLFRIVFHEVNLPIPEWFSGPGHHATVFAGDHEETIVVSLAYWKIDDYRRQWKSACSRVLEGLGTTVFLVDVTSEWHLMQFAQAWTIYRLTEEDLRIQNILLQPHLCPQADLNNPHSAAPSHSTTPDEEENRHLTISEWSTNLEAIREFQMELDRLL